MNLDILAAQKLEQGEIIPRVIVDKIIGFTLRMRPKEHGFQLMKLQAIVEDLLTEKWGDRLAKTCQQDGGIKIMTEAEVILYYKKHWDSVSRSCERASQVLAKRDESILAETELEMLDALKARYAHLNVEAKKAKETYPVKGVVKTDIPLQSSFKNRKRA